MYCREATNSVACRTGKQVTVSHVLQGSKQHCRLYHKERGSKQQYSVHYKKVSNNVARTTGKQATVSNGNYWNNPRLSKSNFTCDSKIMCRGSDLSLHAPFEPYQEMCFCLLGEMNRVWWETVPKWVKSYVEVLSAAIPSTSLNTSDLQEIRLRFHSSFNLRIISTETLHPLLPAPHSYVPLTPSHIKESLNLWHTLHTPKLTVHPY